MQEIFIFKARYGHIFHNSSFIFAGEGVIGGPSR